MSSSAVPVNALSNGYSETPVVVENYDTNASASEITVWNRSVNGEAEKSAGTVETGIVVGGADLWPSLSEGINTRYKPSYRTVPESSAHITSRESSSRSNVRNGGRTSSAQNGGRSRANRQSRNAGTRSNVGNGERSHQHRQTLHDQVTDVLANNGSQNVNSQSDAGKNKGPRQQFHNGGSNPQHQDSNQRGNGGTPRGDDPHGPLRNVDRDAISHPPNLNGRNSPVQPPVFPVPLIPIPRPALPLAPYPPISPPPFPPMPYLMPGIPPFAGGRVLYVPPAIPILMRPHPQFRPVGPPFINAQLCKQIDYYFSDENLVKDVHLRKNMDEHGWVTVDTIASFKKVDQIITPVKPFLDEKKIDHLWFILNAMLNSYVVEVQGNKLRKRIDWKKYILRNSGEASSTAAEGLFESSSAAIESHVNGELAELLSSDCSIEVEDKAADDPGRKAALLSKKIDRGSSSDSMKRYTHH